MSAFPKYRYRACGRGATAVFFLLGLISACREAPEPLAPITTTPTAPEDRYAHRIARVLAEGGAPEKVKKRIYEIEYDRAQERQSILDRQELVIPPPPGFKSIPGRKRLRLSLAIEKEIIRRGEAPRFRLDLINVSSVAYEHRDRQSSLFKDGGLTSSNHIRFYLTAPNGRDWPLIPPLQPESAPLPELSFPPGWTRAQIEAELDRSGIAQSVSRSLAVSLAPGETLRMRGDAPGDSFRTLRAAVAINAAGRYCLRARFDDSLSPLTEESIRLQITVGGRRRDDIVKEHRRYMAGAEGRIEASAACFEVVQ